jgi:hypothetical protein
MIIMLPVVGAGAALPRDRTVRARLAPHLDDDPELLTSLLIHLDLARDDLRPGPRWGIRPRARARLRRLGRPPDHGPGGSSPAA